MTAKQALLGCLMFACGAVVVSLASAHPRQGVEHAPTVEQCQADRAYWASKQAQPDGKGTDDVPFSTLVGWDAEMDKCRAVDLQNHWQYFNVGEEAVAEMAIRERAFIVRHKMWDQFIAEDTEGMR